MLTTPSRTVCRMFRVNVNLTLISASAPPPVSSLFCDWLNITSHVLLWLVNTAAGILTFVPSLSCWFPVIHLSRILNSTEWIIIKVVFFTDKITKNRSHVSHNPFTDQYQSLLPRSNREGPKYITTLLRFGEHYYGSQRRSEKICEFYIFKCL